MSVKSANIILCPVSLYNLDKSRDKQAELKTEPNTTGPERERSIPVGLGCFGAKRVK